MDTKQANEAMEHITALRGLLTVKDLEEINRLHNVVEMLAGKMKERLIHKFLVDGFTGWDQQSLWDANRKGDEENAFDVFRRNIIHHAEGGNWIDVANFAMFAAWFGHDLTG